MTELTAPGRSYHPDDHVVIEVDIEDCPVADVPLTEIFDTVNLVLVNAYLDVLKMYIAQQLEDTIWLDDQSNTPLFDAGFATFHRKADGTVQSLRKPALQRLIERTIRDRPNVTNPIGVKLLKRFQIPISKLPQQSRSPPTVPSVIRGLNLDDKRSDRRESQTGLSGTRSSVAPQESSASSVERDEINATLRFTGPPLLDNVRDRIPATPIAERNSPTAYKVLASEVSPSMSPSIRPELKSTKPTVPPIWRLLNPADLEVALSSKTTNMAPHALSTRIHRDVP
jgi:hypothetical protein